MNHDHVGEWREAGLYDPDAQNAADRLALEHLHERGATLDAMLEAERIGNLPGLAGELARRGVARGLTLREVAERAEVSLEAVTRMSRAAGLAESSPDERVFRESDVEAFRAFGTGVEFFGEDSVLQFTRVVGAAVASIADAAMSEFTRDAQPRLREESELEQARAVEFAAGLLVEQVPAAIQTLFFHHVDVAARRLQISGSAAATANLAVGFLDLVGSTALGEQLGPHELGGALADFERDAVEVIGSHGGRLVKTIGDEVMFVANSALDACAIAVDIGEHVDRHPALPKLRGGLGVGGLVRGYGDYYGPVVNTASRIVKLAEPGCILVTEDVRRLAGDGAGFRFTSAGERELRGITAPVALHAVERA